jgi:hypothetical protein
MPTYAQLSADLLKDAARFFKTLAAQNEEVRKEMLENAVIYERMASLIAEEPAGSGPGGDTYGMLAGKLLRDTAKFFRTLAGQNEPVREQMEQNAAIYDQIAESVINDPLGIMD